MTVTIIGIGLIGGSFAIALKERGVASHVIGVDNNLSNLDIALNRGFIDQGAQLEEAIAQSQLVVLAVPVDAMMGLLPKVLNHVTNQVVMDMGSTKQKVIASASASSNSGRFVATHPMWGTEYSGPEAAVSGAFINKAVVICD